MEVPSRPDDMNMIRLKQAAEVCDLHINFFIPAAGAECRHIIESGGCPILRIIDQPGEGPTYQLQDNEKKIALPKRPETIVTVDSKFL